VAAKRVCLDCPTRISSGSRCARCTRERDRARGTRQQRGYDAAYDATRRELQQRMDAGEVFMCWRCPELGRPAHPVDPSDWHLGHDNLDRSVLRGPQCPATNLATSRSQGWG
jgi:5-methylcytosine-specific restriction endonuclease McrA